MSADDWQICPICMKRIERRVREDYGKIEQIKYQTLLKVWEWYRTGRKPSFTQEEEESGMDIPEDVRTVSIYVDYGVNENGRLIVNIGAGCDKCGASWNIYAEIPEGKSIKIETNKEGKILCNGKILEGK